MIIYKNNFFKVDLLLTLLVCTIGICPYGYGQSNNIKNDVFWDTADGKPIYSQGGGIFRFADPVTGVKKYYWYGVHYQEAESYRNNPSVTYTKKCTFKSVTCYSSTDLANWKFEGDVLTKNEVNKSRKEWVGRLGVAYIKELKKYAIVVQHGAKVLFAVSDSPTGQFTSQHEISMEPMIGTTNTGDQTVFTDEDTEKSYLIYSYGRGRNKIYVSEIGVKDGKVNLLDCTQIFEGESREGNCMFKYNNRYYMFASNIYGWDASHAYYLVADNIRGPYAPTNDMLVLKGASDDYAHISQTGFFCSVKGKEKETIIYCGDRWANFAGNGLGYNQWCPISFEGETPVFNSLSSWNLNAQTGTWEVAEDNNYVKNGSFEADRRYIPSHYKPVQTVLTGWITEAIEGNRVGLDSTSSPVLNYFNNESDRKVVIGEKSLNFSDKVNFNRKVSQIIESTPYVKLTDGNYTLSAKVKNSSGFKNLEMYAESAGTKTSFNITEQNSAWTPIELKNVAVKEGKVEIGFCANGAAGAQCQVDDLMLVRSR